MDVDPVTVFEGKGWLEYVEMADHIRNLLVGMEVPAKTRWEYDGRYFEVRMDSRTSSEVEREKTEGTHTGNGRGEIHAEGGCAVCERDCDNNFVDVIMANLHVLDDRYDWRCKFCGHLLSYHSTQENSGAATIFDTVSNSWLTVGCNPEPFQIPASAEDIRQTIEASSPDGLARRTNAATRDPADSK